MNSLITVTCGLEYRIVDAIREVRECSGCDELIIVDNSPTPLYRDVAASLKCRYLHTMGFNTYYGGGINAGVQVADGDYVIYFSSKRGKVICDDWIEDITQPLSEPRIGMAGCLQPMQGEESWLPFLPEEKCVIPENRMHLQGGVWAARRQVMLDNPYGSRFPQVYSDVWMTAKLHGAGYKLANVLTIKAVSSGVVEDLEKYSFVVDYS